MIVMQDRRLFEGIDDAIRPGELVPDWLGRTSKKERPSRGPSEPASRNGQKHEPPSFISMKSLLAEPDESTKWLVDGLLPDGGTSLLVAKPKVGKSTFAQNLAFHIARGEPFLGLDVAPGPVFYLALEEKRSELRRHFAAMGATDDDDIAFYVARAPEGALTWLTREAEVRKPRLIVIDTFQRFARLRDINDYAAVTNALDPVTNLARSTGAHLLMTHHGKKAGGADGDAVLGSTALFGAVDTLLEMHRREIGRSLSSIQRYGDAFEETVITLDASTYRISAQGSTQEADRRRVADLILTYLKTRGEPVQAVEIFAEVEARRQVKIAALADLVEDGTVVRSGAGKKGDPYLYELSGFLVPTLYAEPENQNPKTAEKPSNDGVFSSSQPSPQTEDGREPQFATFEAPSAESAPPATACAFFIGTALGDAPCERCGVRWNAHQSTDQKESHHASVRS